MSATNIPEQILGLTNGKPWMLYSFFTAEQLTLLASGASEKPGPLPGGSSSATTGRT